MAGGDNFIGDAWIVIRPDLSKFEAELIAGVEAALASAQAVIDAHPLHVGVVVDTSGVAAQIAAVENTPGGQVEVNVGANVAPALAEIAAVAQTAPTITIPVTADVAPLVAEMAVAHAAASTQGGKTGVLGTLLWGVGGIAGFAAFGSLASLAGLGFEHMITTGIGLVGSLAGAIGGGLLLAIGAAGVALVGMGSDLLVMKTAASDVTNYQNAIDKLTRAIAVYGVNSTVTKGAQYDLNQITQNWTASLLASVQATAAAKQATITLWQTASAVAKIAADGIMQQVYTLANVFIPLVANAAARNLTIIGNAIKPLFLWLSTTGTLIFQNLENIFARNLPTAVHAFTMGIEFLLKTINFMSFYTGGLVKAIDTLLTRANSPAGFMRWETIMLTLVDMFRTWWALIKEVTLVLFHLFSQSVGLGTSIVTTITQMLVKLDAWLVSSSGKNAIHTLFAVHLQEVLALLGLLPPLLSAFSQLYLMIAPPLTLLVAGLATVVGWMLKIPVVGPMLAWGLAIAFLASKLKLLALASVIGDFYALGTAFVVFAGEEGIAAAATATFGGLLAIVTAPVTLIVAAIALLVGALVLLVTHFSQVKTFVLQAWGALETFFKDLPMHIGQAVGAVVLFFTTLPGRILTALGDAAKTLLKWGGDAIHGLATGAVAAWPTVSKWFVSLPGLILTALGNAGLWLLKTAGSAIAGFLLGLVQALPTVLKWFVLLPVVILALLTKAAIWLFQTGWNMLTGLLGGIGQGAVAVWKWFTSLPGVIWGLLSGAPGWLTSSGSNIIGGLLAGIVNAAIGIWSWFTSLPMLVLHFFANAVNWLYNIGKDIINGLWNGLKAAWSGVSSWIGSVVGSIPGIFKSILGIASPSKAMHDIGLSIMDGLNSGLKAGATSVMGTMSGLSGAMKGSISVGSLGIAGHGSVPLGVGIGGGAGSINVTNHFYNNSGSPAELQGLIDRSHAKLVTALRAGRR